MSKAVIGGVAGLVTVLAIGGGVFVATASPSWESELRAAVQEDFETDPEAQEGCASIGFLGAESPEELADSLTSLGANNLEEEYGDLPEGVTSDEAFVVVIEEIWNLCDL